MLWLTVHLIQHPEENKQEEINLKLPLVVENLASNLLVLEGPTEVFVTVSGSMKNLEEAKPSSFKAFLDLQGKSVGAYQNVPVRVATPPGLLVANVNPSRADVVLDEVSGKKVPVTWDMEGLKNAPRIRIKPEEVTVSGSKLQVDRVVAAQVEISASEDAANSVLELSPSPVDALGRPVPGPHVSPQNVVVTLEPSGKLKPIVVRPSISGFSSPIESVSVIPSVVMAEIPRGKQAPPYLSTSPIDVTGKHGDVIEKVKVLVPSGIKLPESNQVTVILKLGNSQ